MALTRRTPAFARFAERIEQLLADRGGAHVTGGQVDAGINCQVEQVAVAMGVSTRTALRYAPGDLPETMTSVILEVLGPREGERLATSTPRGHLRLVTGTEVSDLRGSMSGEALPPLGGLRLGLRPVRAPGYRRGMKDPSDAVERVATRAGRRELAVLPAVRSSFADPQVDEAEKRARARAMVRRNFLRYAVYEVHGRAPLPSHEREGWLQPHSLYLVHFPDDRLLKVGLTRVLSRRLSDLRSRRELVVVDMRSAPTRFAAQIAECDVLDSVEPWALDAQGQRRWGAGGTETWRDDGPDVDLVAFIDAAIGDVVRAASTSGE